MLISFVFKIKLILCTVLAMSQSWKTSAYFCCQVWFWPYYEELVNILQYYKSKLVPHPTGLYGYCHLVSHSCTLFTIYLFSLSGIKGSKGNKGLYLGVRRRRGKWNSLWPRISKGILKIYSRIVCMLGSSGLLILGEVYSLCPCIGPLDVNLLRLAPPVLSILPLRPSLSAFMGFLWGLLNLMRFFYFALYLESLLLWFLKSFVKKWGKEIDFLMS